jgi:hypothetical protein
VDLIERDAAARGRHPWEIARARFFLRLLDRLGCLTTTPSWLDVGAGDAWFAERLRPLLPETAALVCWDVDYGDAELSASDAPAGIDLTAERPAGTFGGVMMLDVIEHVEDDIGFVRDIVGGSLASDGWVLVSVPAYQALFSDHDRFLRHYRRYSPRALRDTLEAAGLTVVARGGLFHALLPLRAAQVARERHRRPVAQRGIGGWQGSERLSRGIVFALELDSALSLFAGERHLPVVPGLSTWAFCRRAADVVP